MIGRNLQRTAIREMLEDARTGPCGVLLVGDAGIGKTALARSAADEAARGGFRVLSCAGTEAERELPYAVLTNLLPTAPQSPYDDLPLAQRRALERVLVLGEDAGPVEPRAVGMAVLGVLDRLTSQEPLLLVLDDLHWMDDASGFVLGFALRRLDDAPVAVVGTQRRRSRPLLDLWAALPSERLRELEIGPLDTDALSELIIGRLGHRPALPVLDQIESLAGGNPLVAMELLRVAESDPGLLVELPTRGLPDRLWQLLGQRIDKLPSETRRALAVVAATSNPSDSLLRTLGVRPGVMDAALDTGVVERAGGRWRFTHPLLRSVATADADESFRRSVHRRLAETVTDPVERAGHVGRSVVGARRGGQRRPHRLRPRAPRRLQLRVGGDGARPVARRAAGHDLRLPRQQHPGGQPMTATGALGPLSSLVSGRIVTRDDADYDEARRVRNAMIDRWPRAIVRCDGVPDVAAVVRHAADRGLDLAVRGGGHSVPGFGTVDDGIVIDLAGMRSVDVDPVARRAVVAGGATWNDVNAATGAHGLATTGGIVSTTGVGGLTLGGGIGYLSRAYGLSCDNLESVEIVTADGAIREVSAEQQPDLFWAIRGGGGNFGVVTSFRFRLHPVAEVYGGPMFFDIEHAESVLRAYRDLIARAPEQLSAFSAFQIAPPLPFIPEELHGSPMVLVVACWSGDVTRGEEMLRPLHEAAPVAAEHVGVMPYAALNSAFDGLYPPGLQHYWKTAFVNELTDDAIAAHLRFGPRVPAVTSTMHLYPIDGACNRVAEDATAFAARDARFAAVIVGMWPDAADNEANMQWVRDYHAAIAPHSQQRGYVNFMSGDDEAQVPAAYAGNYARLREVKRRFDPGNVFHVNQNIRP